MGRRPLGPGIYHGNLNFESTSDDFIDNTQLFHYPTFTNSPSGSLGDAPLSDPPTSIALTEFHFVLLYFDRIAGICILDEKLAYEEILPLVSKMLLLEHAVANSS